jgi:hypothetical protein
MSGFDLFDPGLFVTAEEPPTTAPQLPEYPVITGNPLLDRPDLRPRCPMTADKSDSGVAECSTTVAAEAAPRRCAETAENHHSAKARAESVATVASVADCQTGVRLLASLPRPEVASQRRWEQLVADAQAFERIWLDQAVRCGWSAIDIFGCAGGNPDTGRLDRCGLVVLLQGRTVADLNEDSAAIVDPRGGQMRFYRRPYPGAQLFQRLGSRLLWDAYSGGNQ